MTVFQYHISLYLTMYMYSILSKFAAIRSLTAMAVCVFTNKYTFDLSIYLSTCTARILARAFRACVCSDVIRTAKLKWGPFGRWTQSRVRLSAEPAFCAFSNTLCGMSHGYQHKTASSRAVKSLITNAWLYFPICVYRLMSKLLCKVNFEKEM